MVDVEHRALRAFEHDALATGDRVIEQAGGITDHGANARCECLVFVTDVRQVQLLVDAERLGDGLLLFHQCVVACAECVLVEQVRDTHAAPSGLVLIARAYTARRGADRNATGPALGHLLHHAMAGEKHVRAVADPQPPVDLHAGVFQSLDFRQQRSRVDDEAIANDGLASPQNAAGDELEDELLVTDADGVTGVMSPLIAGDDIEMGRQQVDDLPFSLVSPLGSDHYQIGHGAAVTGGCRSSWRSRLWSSSLRSVPL